MNTDYPMPTENRSNDADGWIACDDGLHLIQMDKNLSHYGWVFRNIDGGLPYSVREATPHEMAHAQARQHLRIGVAQIAGQEPPPQPHPEPIAWMVGTAFWWTKEEAERDAAETGLPIVGLGPMTCAAPAEQHQGEPVAWMYKRKGAEKELGQLVTMESEDIKDIRLGKCYENGTRYLWPREDYIDWKPLYTHADPGEVERLRGIIRMHEKTVREQTDHLAYMRAQLAERDALLHSLDCAWNSHDGKERFGKLMRKVETLAASAEPCAAVEVDHDALVAAVCVLRSQGLGNLSAAVEEARTALERKPS